jgi:hypothetical protein
LRIRRIVSGRVLRVESNGEFTAEARGRRAEDERRLRRLRRLETCATGNGEIPSASSGQALRCAQDDRWVNHR